MNKYMNQLKELGMQNEFKSWLVDIKKRPFKFEVGARVILKPTRYKEYDRYQLKEGDKGVIRKLDDTDADILSVTFDKNTIYVWKQDIRLI